MKTSPIYYPEKKTKSKPLKTKIVNNDTAKTIHGVALLKVPFTVGN